MSISEALSHLGKTLLSIELDDPQTPPRKKPKRQCHFDPSWMKERFILTRGLL